ncbi:MAG: thiamine pyrophosphate protein binding domain protein [Thermoleophilia bacterium]|nr:thiamine pyrophosphate protein binding domain protein [Thermoleophilia bacterium]
MSATTVSDFVLDRLEQWGVTRLFGYPGDGINGLFGALARAGDRFEFVQARHEETAALMAVAHAKLTDAPSVCVATSGPGAIHLLNGLYDAKKDHQPVVAIVGQQARSTHGADQHQEVDLEALFSDVASAFCQTVTVPEQARMVIDRALRIATTRRAPTVVILPNDVQELDAVVLPERAHGMSRTSHVLSQPNVVPDPVDLRIAADLLNAGRRVAMLIGSGARGAVAEVRAVADVLDAGIAKALLGKDVLPDDVPGVTGTIGLLGTKPSWELMQGCDVLLMVGTSFPYTEFLPDGVPAVQVDLDPTRIGLRYPTEVNLVGDARLTLAALLPLLERHEERGAWRERIVDDVAKWDAQVVREAEVPADPINPQHVAVELSRHLPDRAIVTADSGTSVSWFARHLHLREGMRGTLSGQLASMGVGVPYAIGAKFAHPDRPVVAFVGDGSMQMNGLAELLTIARYAERWPNQQLVVVVLDNGDLNMVTWEQRVMAGDPRFDASQDLPPVDYAAVARAMGIGAERVEDPAEVAGAFDRAFAANAPFLLDMVVDPNVPPMPPHVTFEQAKHLMFALAKGDSERGGIIRQTIRETVASHRR